MSKYDLGYNRAQKSLLGVLRRPNSDSWELEEEFSDEVKSGQNKKLLLDGKLSLWTDTTTQRYAWTSSALKTVKNIGFQ